MTNTTKKITKKENYNAMLDILAAMENDGITIDMGEITYESLREFITGELVSLDKRAAAAAKRAADKREEGDALRERIFGVLSNSEFMTTNDVVKALDDETVSAQMVTARLTQLIKLGTVEKDSISVAPTAEGGKAKKLTAYRAI